MKNIKTYLIFLILLNLAVNNCLLAQTDYIWNINDSCLFDNSDKDYAIKDGCVTVDLKSDNVLCPTGLGHLVSGRESVKEIRILFTCSVIDNCWLHVCWEPGGSGKEQFEILCNSSEVQKSILANAEEKPNQTIAEKFKVKLTQGDNNIIIKHLSGDGLRFKYIFLSKSDNEPARPLLNPNLKFATLKAYETECKEPGVMLDDIRLRLFAPKKKAKEAEIVFEYLIKAYDELYSIVGSPPEYKLVIYHFPEDSEYGWGGTSECSIWYSYKNLEFESQKEWQEYHVPHLSGYIEEMAHNFDGATGAQFGWEMTGWNLGVIATQKAAGNPIFTEQVNRTRSVQEETFQRYIENNYTFPKDIPGNLSDRIHAHVLWLCEKEYGSDFWKDFFREIQKERDNFESAKYLKDPDKIRNKKYQITVECFDRLEKIEFRKMLDKYHLSQTTAIKSLRPTEPNWDRKFIPPDDNKETVEVNETITNNQQNSISVDVEKLPPFHKAAYEGHNQTVSRLIEQGHSVNEKGPYGWTPLHMAAIGGHQMLAELLLEKGSDIKAVDNEGHTPANLAQIFGHDGLFEFLKSKE